MISVFGAGRAHHAYLFANRMKGPGAQRHRRVAGCSRLNSGSFAWPHDVCGTLTLTTEQLNALVIGLQDILIAVTDGLKGMPEARGAVFPATMLQTCIAHLIRSSLGYTSWKDRQLLAAAIKPIYTAVRAETAQAQLEAFEQAPWGQK